ncbi:tachykinins isoform X2 [Orussus abietinus]|uniref:tachykinins isoform X2 n=1 Tax=Orussus abietinus TaxID=222816 RepID=UPI000C715ADF|nr:tachykinins isoform X2 [Orussus abietinus]
MFVGSSIILAVLIVPSLTEKTSSNDVLSLHDASLLLPEMRDRKELTSVERRAVSKRAPMGFQVLDEIEKRAAMGFQGMRGKKNYYLEYPEDNEKRAMAMGFQGMRGKKDEWAADWEKRKPMGFQGMRGKKSFQDELDELEKRAIMGFQGMRGKKYYNDIDEFAEDYEKRAPKMGFQGMRGKKDIFDSDKSAPMSFQDTRGKKTISESYDDGVMDLSDYEKRALMGFQGMRGKKDSDKRAPMGFQGMRGKKDLDDPFGSTSEFSKRAPMGFQGMRGKKDENPIEYEPFSPFTYFDSRGKKTPRFAIRGKFVAVRGKKWSEGSLFDQSENLLDNIGRTGVNTDSTTTLDIQ